MNKHFSLAMQVIEENSAELTDLLMFIEELCVALDKELPPNVDIWDILEHDIELQELYEEHKELTPDPYRAFCIQDHTLKLYAQIIGRDRFDPCLKHCIAVSNSYEGLTKDSFVKADMNFLIEALLRIQSIAPPVLKY